MDKLGIYGRSLLNSFVAAPKDVRSLLGKDGTVKPEVRAEFAKYVEEAGIPFTSAFEAELTLAAHKRHQAERPYGFFMDGDPGLAAPLDNADLFKPADAAFLKRGALGVKFMSLVDAGLPWYYRTRLLEYAGWPNERFKAVDRAMSRLLEGLDQVCQLGDRNVVSWAMFKTDLRDVLAKPEARALLRELPGRLQAAVDRKQPFDLWSFATEYVRQSGVGEENVRSETVRWLGTMLQDYSGAMGIGYAINERLADDDTLKALRQSLILLKNNQGTEGLTLYPPDVPPEVQTHRVFYHYYPMALLTERLLAEAKTPEDRDAAVTASVVFNMEYEYLFINLREAEIGKPVSPLGLRRPIDRALDEGDLRDMYVGVCAALASAGLRPRPYEEFAAAVAGKPFEALRDLVSKGVAHSICVEGPPPGEAPPPPPDFPDNFLFGSAIAGLQTEVGLHNTDWHLWQLLPGKIENGHLADNGPDFVHIEADGSVGGKYVQYIAEAKAMGHNSFRFSMEWARLQPTPNGPYDPAALRMYHVILDECRKQGLEPMVTLNHFALPDWINDPRDLKGKRTLGGWHGPVGCEPGKAPIIDAFAKYAGDMAREFGSKVDLWVTINEPMATVSAGYLSGDFPAPGPINFDGARKAMINMAYAHAKAYDAIKANDTVDADGDGKPSMVGMAQHLREYAPTRPNSKRDQAATEQIRYLMNQLLTDAVTTGDADWDADGDFSGPHEGRGIPELKGRLDFFGANYYTLDHVTALPIPVGPKGFKLLGLPYEKPLRIVADVLKTAVTHKRAPVKVGPNQTDMGWVVHPQGAHDILVWAAQRWSLPIFVTENGIADAAETDKRRASFIVSHLAEIQRAMADGADVRGYMHWSLMDNFEWVYGFRPRFGLLRVDFLHPERQFRRTLGAEAYSAIIARKSVTDAIREMFG